MNALQVIMLFLVLAIATGLLNAIGQEVWGMIKDYWRRRRYERKDLDRPTT